MVRVTCEVTTRTVPDNQMRKMHERHKDMAAKLTGTHPDVEVVEVGALVGGELPVLLLTEVGGTRMLPIFCGAVEATAIALAQKGVEIDRPMTHDLLRDVVSALGKAHEVRITELRDGTYLGELAVADAAGEERAVACRPSDGIALAVRADVPILVAEALFIAETGA